MSTRSILFHQLLSLLRRWCSFGSAVAGTDANITFYEYGQDGSVLHQTPTKIKVLIALALTPAHVAARLCRRHRATL